MNYEEWFDSLFAKDSDDLMDILRKKEFKDRVVSLNEGVDSDSIGDLITKLRILDDVEVKDIILRVNSNGGEVYEFLRLYDCIQKLQSKVHIINEGKAFSAGSWIVGCAATGKRYANANSTFMLHQVSSWAMGKCDELINEVEEVKRLQDILKGMLKKHTKMKKKHFQYLKEKDWYFDAKEAKKVGIIDVIL